MPQQSYYEGAQGYISAIGGQAKEAVEEVYSDATDAGGFIIETFKEVVTAPGKALTKVGEGIGKGAEAMGKGVGEGAEETPKALITIGLLAAAVGAVYFLKR